MNFKALLKSLDLDATGLASGSLAVRSPIDGKEIARVRTHTPAQVGAAVGKAARAFQQWRDVPAPKRGELIRLLGEELRAAKDQLGELVTVENGKILRGTMQKIADGQDYKMPATIDDPAILPEIAEALATVGYAAPRLSRSL